MTYRTVKEVWRDRLGPELDAHGFRRAGALACRRSASGQVGVLVEQQGSRFDVGPGHGVPASYQLHVRVVACPAGLPPTPAKLRTAPAHPVMRADPRGLFATGPFERLAAAGLPAPAGFLDEEEAVGFLARVAGDSATLDTVDDLFAPAERPSLDPQPLGLLALAAELGRVDLCRALVAAHAIDPDHVAFTLKPFGLRLG